MSSDSHEISYRKTQSDHHKTLLSNSQPESISSSSIFKQWKFEILSWLGSLCFFIAIIIVLWRLDGHPIPKLPSGVLVTPNAVIGLLATFVEILLIVPVHSAIGQVKWLRALKTTPMADFQAFDEASRGPWGSALLVVRRKGGYVYWSYYRVSWILIVLNP